jgi:Do/DeqQ family serine protease
MGRLALSLAIVAALLGAPAAAQSIVPSAPGQVRLTFAPIVKRVAPSVVNVYGQRVDKTPRHPFMDDPVLRRFFSGEFGVPQERVQRSLGSGVIIDPAGFVVTNNHVVEGMTEAKVALADKREFEAEFVLRDPRTDLAVLRIKGAGPFTAIEIGDPDALEVGDFVMAVGNPFGVGQTVTQGIVSALARTQVGASDYQFFIQTDAAINPGNSGGALVDTAGRLVGINTAIFSQSGGSHGIGFAIPASMVKVVLASAKSGAKTVARPWFGARLQQVTPELMEGLGLDRPIGALVADIAPKSPAAEAGLKQGDVIVAVDTVAVDDPEAFGFRFATKPLGSTAQLGIRRAGRAILVPVHLVAAPETRPRELTPIKGRWPLAGATIGNLSPALADELAVDTAAEGVVVTAVAENSAAAQLGLQKGDILIAIDGEKIDSVKDVQRLAKPRNYYWKITISRGGQVITSAVAG